MGKMSRDKGARGEREIANILKAAGIPAMRSQQHKGAADAADETTYLDDLFYLEVKRTEKLSLYPVMKIAKDEAGEDKTPLILHRKNQEKWLAIMEFDALIGIFHMFMPWMFNEKGTVSIEEMKKEIENTTYTIVQVNEPAVIVERETGRIVCRISTDFLRQVEGFTRKVATCKNDAEIIAYLRQTGHMPMNRQGGRTWFPRTTNSD